VLARFESERQALALMDHPHIARVLDAGTTGDGRPFFVMDLVRGIPLTDYCDRHRLGLPERLELFRQICSAVQHAHQKGIIHRDLKPSNIQVESHDGHAVPKVIDFGLAKAISGHQLSEHSLFTAFGSVAGTPLYMAPEQASFNALDVDTRADIYALGVILYELLTGSMPIRRETFRQAAIDEVLRMVREVEPPTPSNRISTSEALPSLAATRQAEPARLSRFVRRDLDWIVMKALAKERQRRYESASALAQDIERFTNHEPFSAGPPTAAYRFRKFVRRNRPQVIAASLVFLTLVAGIVGTTLGLLEAKRQAGIALAEAKAKEEARQAEALQRQKAEKRLAQIEKSNEILGSIFKGLNPSSAEKGDKPLAALLGERLDQATAQIEGEAIGDSLAVARMQMTLGESQLGLGYPEKAIALFTKARATFITQLGPDHPHTLAGMNNLAEGYRAAGQLDRALPLLEETLRLMRSKLGPDHPYTLSTMDNLAAGYRNVGKLDQALPLFEATLALMRSKFGPHDPRTLMTMNDLASAYQAAGQLGRALPLLEETLTLRKARLGPDHPDTLASMNNLASAYQEAGKLDRALPLLEQTHALTKSKLGPDHPDTLTTLNNLATGYRAAGEHGRALPLSEEAFRLRKSKLGLDHPHTLISMNNLASAYWSAGKLDRSVPLYEELLKLRAAKSGADHPDTLESLHNKLSALWRRNPPLPLVAHAYIRLCRPATFFMISGCRPTGLRYRSQATRHTFIVPIPCSAATRRCDSRRFPARCRSLS
jgi:tetratricopeptide (TPR) repeat protein